MYAMSVILYAAGTLLKYKSNNQTDTRELILKMELPFEIKSTSVYIIVLFTQFVHQTSAASTIGVLNSLLITLVLHVCGQIDIVRQRLNEITRKNIKQGVTVSIMKTLIVRHQRIISFSKNIESLFSSIALVQFVSNTLVICCLGFLIVISIGAPGGSTMLVKSVLFYVVICLDAFIFCFVGEYLSTKSRMIGDAAYESLWYESNPNQNRDVLLMIIRSQKHLTLTVGKFVDLSFQQFANIFQYRYLIMHFGDEDLFTLMDVLSATLAYSLLFIKMIIFTFNVHILNKIIACIIEDWKIRDISEEYTMTKVAYISRQFSNLIITMYAMSVFVYATGTLFRYKSSNQTDTRELILKMELPFEIKNTLMYIAVLITQFIHQVSGASMEGVFISLLITLSRMIGDAAYESLWYESNPNQKRDVLLMIMRSQKYLTLTVGNLINSDLINNEIGSMNSICQSTEFGLRAIGVWPDTSYAILRRILCISSMAVFQTFQYQYLFMHFEEEDLYILMDVLSGTVAYSLLLIKLIIFAFNAHLLSEIIAHIVEDWKERDVSEEYTMTRIAYISRRLSNLIIIMYAMTVFLYATSTVLRYKSTNQTDTRELILKMELPFEMKSTSVYIAVLVIQFVHQTSAASTEGVINSLLITLSISVPNGTTVLVKSVLFYIAINLDAFIFCFVGEYLSTKSRLIGDAAYNSLWYDSNLNQHRNVLLMIMRSQKHLQLTAGKFVDLSLQQFANSRMIGNAAYESLWYESNPSLNKNVLLMIVRSQKHLQLTAGKFVDLSLQQFTNSFQYRYLIMHFNENDLFILMDVLSGTLIYSLLFIKLIIFMFNAHLLNEIITHVVEDWKRHDTFEESIMIRIAYVSRRISNLIITLYAMTVFCYATSTVLRYKIGNQTDARELIFKMELPFEIKSTSVYIVVLVILFVYQTSAASTTGILNSLLITLSRMIGNAAYESLWYESNPNLNRNVLIMIVRSQKHLQLTAGKFMDLSLQQFTNYRYLIMRFGKEDLFILMDVLSATLAYSLLLFKLIVFAFNAHLLNEIITRIVEDWKRHDVSEEYTMTRIAYLSRRFSNLIITMYMISVFLYATGTLLRYNSNNQTDARELILKMELPFEMKSTSVLHACGQIDIVRHKLSAITQKNIERGITETIMKTLIIRHQRIISFSKDIEVLYSSIALIQFVSNTLVICCLGFLIVISRMIGDAAYESLWYESNPNLNRNILLMIVRSQKHLTLTAGKFMDLSLQEFANYRYLIMRFGKEDLFILMDVLSITLAYSLVLIKLIIFACNAHLLNEIITRIVEDWKRHDVSEEYTMTRIAYLSRRFSNLIITMYMISVFLYATGTLLRYNSNNQTDARELILKMELPFEMKSTSVYIIVLITQFIHQISAASTTGVLNSLLIILVLHACGQIDIMRHKLSAITQKNIERGITETIMKTLIIRHQRIISFSKDIEVLYSSIALIQFVSNTLVICCLGFLIVITTISRLVRFNLHIYGIWPYVPSTVLFRLYWIIMLSTAQVFQYRYVIVNIHMDDFSELMDGIGSAMASSLLYIKLVLLWSNQRIFFDLLQMMSADWQDRQDTINSRVMTETQNAAQRASRWIIGLQIFAVINYTAGVLANNLDKEEPYKRELILKMELPFNISTNSIYTAVQSVQFYHLFFVACGITTINSLLVTLFRFNFTRAESETGVNTHGVNPIFRRIFFDLLQMMSADWQDRQDTVYNLRIMAKTANAAQRASRWIIGLQIFSVFNYAGGVLANNMDKEEPYKRELILKMELPFNISTNSIYAAVQSVQFYHLILVAYGITTVNSLLVTLSLDMPNVAAILVKSVVFYITINIEAFIYCLSGEYLSAKVIKASASYLSLLLAMY
ncbi:Putative odorant receptor 13a [Camponotus floridanus]|uniref:Putative odorant receptor 13a n=1 Tax=Camponotus floridanus TaxID=104421 RepID=E2A3X1_CAMFO|nr:Putative odorant receptor 13a [Camponotus floridanus]